MRDLEKTHKELRNFLAIGNVDYREYVRLCRSYGIKPLLPNGEPLPDNIDGRCINNKRGSPSILPDSVKTE